MVADASGNDLYSVGVPVTGRFAIAPFGTALMTSAQGKQTDISAFMGSFTPLGLFKEDGGPQFAWAASGDPITFWQDGYSIPSGLADVTIAVTAGEVLKNKIREILSGAAPDANGMTVQDGGGPATRWVGYSEEIFKNGAIRRRQAPNITLQSATEDRNTRGDVLGNALVFSVARDLTIGGHFREWVLPAVDTSAKTTWTVTINGTPTGGTYTLIINGVATAPIAFNAINSAIASAINALSGVTGLGTVNVTGTSPTFTVTAPVAVTLSAVSALTGGTSPSVTVA
jgi:hypothetical protein